MHAELDFYFPFIVLSYGLIMSLVTQLPHFKKVAQENFNHEVIQWFYSHRALGLVCLAVGGLWSLQRVLFLF